VNAGVVTADALAGTASLDGADALVRSDKDLREHREVVDGVSASLAPFVTRLEHPAVPLLKTLPNVVHLHTPIRAMLQPGVGDLEVAWALSPTAAVCGNPRVHARAWLREHEGFVRGWYAGAVGFSGPNGTMLSVAIRSALIRGSQATVFVGAGIVEGSTPDGEWLETEQKAKTLLTALGVEHV
jgi:isochorismate synthase EntC